VATGGREKKLRVFDLTRGSTGSSPTSPNATGGVDSTSIIEGHEVSPGTHSDTIKSVLWNVDYNIITTADDKHVRWFDLRSQNPVYTFTTKDDIMSCELNTLQSMGNGDSGVISVAAGKSCYFFNGGRPGEMLKKMDFDQDIASVAINPFTRKVVTGGKNETWAHVWDLETEVELGKHLSCYVFIFQVLTIRQRFKRDTTVRFGPFSSHQMATCTRQAVKMELSSCGRRARSSTVFGDDTQGVVLLVGGIVDAAVADWKMVLLSLLNTPGSRITMH
jgi:hypothetical protein